MSASNLNPYAPTTDTHLDRTSVGPIVQASRLTRLAAAIVDGILMMAIVMPVSFAIGFMQRSATGEVSLIENLLMSFFGMIVMLSVNGYFLATRGQTVGKMLTKIQIVDAETNQLLPFVRVYVYRYLWILPLVILTAVIPGTLDNNLVNLASLVDVLMIFRGDHRCLHDLLAGSKVVAYQPSR